MDDLTAVRELETGTPPLTEAARTAARARLHRAITQETRRSVFGAPSRRLVLRFAVAATVAAAVTGTAVVLADGEDPDPSHAEAPRLTTLGAAQVLHKAADRSRSDSARMRIPRNDQYFYTKEITTRTPLKGGRTEKYTDESWLSVDGSKPSRYSENGVILDEPPLDANEVRWPPTEYAKLRTMPTDPDELLKQLRYGLGSSTKNDESAYMNACLLMRGPRVMPPGLQAAAFEAVAKLPGIVLDDEVDALGRHGIGISYPGMSFGLVFDRDTYAYLGLRQEGIKGQKMVNGESRGGVKFMEVKGLVEAGVVDSMGGRP